MRLAIPQINGLAINRKTVEADTDLVLPIRVATAELTAALAMSAPRTLAAFERQSRDDFRQYKFAIRLKVVQQPFESSQMGVAQGGRVCATGCRDGPLLMVASSAGPGGDAPGAGGSK